MTDYSKKSFFIKPSQKGANDFEDLLSSDYRINISNWIHSGWDIFKKDMGTFIAFAVIGGICYVVINYIPLAGLLVMYPFFAGFIIVSLMLFGNQTTEFKNFLWGFRHFIPLLVFTIVSTVFVLIGLLLLIVPGIYLSIAYMFAPFLIVEKNIDFWPAMEISRKKVNKHFFGIFGFAVVILFINAVGCLPLLLGLLITIPLTTCMMTAAYKDIFMENDQTGEEVTASIEPTA